MNNLTTLQQWNTAAKAMHADIQRYLDVTMCAPEAPHVDSPYATLTAYTKLVGEVIGIDSGHLLQWAFECNFGDIPLYADNKRLTTIEAIYDHYKPAMEEWPCESRIDIIGTNGNNGEHYA